MLTAADILGCEALESQHHRSVMAGGAYGGYLGVVYELRIS